MAATLSVWEACLLGFVQGLTEFLPISSDGHLALVQHFLTPMPADQRLAIDVALHIGTLVAVLFYFRTELIAMAGALFGRAEAPWARPWIWLLAIATVPAVVIGFTLKDRIEATYDSLAVIGVSFVVTGTLLFLASAVRGASRSEEDIGVGDAVVIGSFQALALLPGVSRSGTTISAGLFRHVRSDAAAKFSFLLSIPAIGGAVALELGDIVGLVPSMAGPLLAGVVVAGVTGLAAIALLMRAIRTGRLTYFAYYCWVLGAAVLAGAMLRGGV